MRIVLASASPRRREILSQIGIAPDRIVPTDADETLPAGISPENAVRLLAERKALCAKKDAKPGDLIIASDTVVALQGQILGKPANAMDAAYMLRLLSGKIHQVCTGVCVLFEGKKEEFVNVSEVEFYPLSEQQIEAYLKTDEPFDKAGAYGIQGFGRLLIKRIDGDFYSVMGLPVAETVRACERISGEKLLFHCRKTTEEAGKERL